MAKLSLKTRVDQFNSITKNSANLAGRLLVETIRHAGEHGDRTLTERLLKNASSANQKRFRQFLEAFGFVVKKDGMIEGLKQGYNGGAEFNAFAKLMEEGKGWTSKEVKAIFPEIFPVAIANTGEGEISAPEGIGAEPENEVSALVLIQNQIMGLNEGDKMALSAWLANHLVVAEIVEEEAAA